MMLFVCPVQGVVRQQDHRAAQGIVWWTGFPAATVSTVCVVCCYICVPVCLCVCVWGPTRKQWNEWNTLFSKQENIRLKRRMNYPNRRGWTFCLAAALFFYKIIWTKWQQMNTCMLESYLITGDLLARSITAVWHDVAWILEVSISQNYCKMTMTSNYRSLKSTRLLAVSHYVGLM